MASRKVWENAEISTLAPKKLTQKSDKRETAVVDKERENRYNYISEQLGR